MKALRRAFASLLPIALLGLYRLRTTTARLHHTAHAHPLPTHTLPATFTTTTTLSSIPDDPSSLFSGTHPRRPRAQAQRPRLHCTSRPRDVRGSRSISRSRFGRGGMFPSASFSHPTSVSRRLRRVAHHVPHALRTARGARVAGEHDRSQQVRGGHASSSPNSARTKRRAVRHQRTMSAEGARIIYTATACIHVRRSCSYLGFTARPVSAPFADLRPPRPPALASWPTLSHAHAPHPAQRMHKASTTNGISSGTRTKRRGVERRSVSFRLKWYVKLCIYS